MTIGATTEESPVDVNPRMMFFNTDHVGMFCFMNCKAADANSKFSEMPTHVGAITVNKGMKLFNSHSQVF